AWIVDHELAVAFQRESRVAVEPRASSRGVAAFAIVGVAASLDDADRNRKPSLGRPLTAQHERRRAQAVARDEFAIARERFVAPSERVTAAAVQARERGLELAQRDRIAGRNGDSSGVQ